MNFVQVAELDWLPWQQNKKKKKKKKKKTCKKNIKIIFSEAIRLMKLILSIIFAPTKKLLCIDIAGVLSSLWQLKVSLGVLWKKNESRPFFYTSLQIF